MAHSLVFLCSFCLDEIDVLAAFADGARRTASFTKVSNSIQPGGACGMEQIEEHRRKAKPEPAKVEVA